MHTCMRMHARTIPQDDACIMCTAHVSDYFFEEAFAALLPFPLLFFFPVSNT